MNPAITLTTSKFETSDLALAAFLALKFIVESLDFTDPRRVKFVFNKTDELEAEADLFWKKAALIEPQDYFMSMKALKGRLYNSQPANAQPFYR